MNPNADHVKHLSPAQWQHLEQGMVVFRQNWTETLMAETLGQMPADEPLRYPSLVEMTKADLHERWKQGQRVTLEEYLKSYAELGSVHTVGVDLIRAEYEARKAAGDRVEVGEYARRFPDQFDALQDSLKSGKSLLASPVAAAFGTLTPMPFPGNSLSAIRTPAYAVTASSMPKPRTRWPWLVGAPLLLLAALVGWYAYTGGFHGPQNRPVPGIVGLSKTAVAKALTDAGLTMTIIGDPKLGKAAAQKPAAGEPVNAGDVITVVFPVQVPNVVGQSAADATAALTAAGLKMASSGDATSGNAQKQSTAAGGTATPGDTITVLFPQVTAPTLLAVPKVVGQTQAAATATLTAAHLSATISGDPKLGNAVDQNPAAGSQASKGDAVTVIFPAQVPKVIGQSQAAAAAALTAAGLTMKSTGDPASGSIQKQNPAPGVLAAPGDAVTIIFPVQVPNVVGQTSADASAALTAAGLNVASNGDPKLGNAISQKPAAGGLAIPGDAITVVFPAPAAASVPVPKVLGQTQAAAAAALTAAGLTMTISGDPKLGTSISQNPAAGATATQGDAVAVIFPVQVPNVVGQSQATAAAALTVAGLNMTSAGDPTSGNTKKQSPAAGVLATPGDAVTVIFAVQVPDIVGQAQAAANAALSAVGLTATSSGDPKLGNIISQKPAAGGLAIPGDAIAAIFPVQVPSVVGQTQAAATTALSAADLTVTSSGDPKLGNAISQNPAAGSLAAPSDAITVVFPVQIPNVVGQTQAAASAALTTAGLTLTMSGDPKLGNSVSQNPVAGGLAAPGGAITAIFPVQVPNVVGQSQAAASAVLTAAGLSLTSSGDPTSGGVQKQNLAAGVLATPGDVIAVIFPVHVPNVLGQTPGTAAAALTAAGMTMASSGNPKLGSAISQNPAPGVLAIPGDAIKVFFPMKAPTDKVPNIVGQSKAVATATLASAGLTMTISGDPKLGKTIGQNPAAGGFVAAGSAIAVIFPTQVPNVVGQTQAGAAAALTAAGLNLKSIGDPASGNAKQQNPAAGVLAAPEDAGDGDLPRAGAECLGSVARGGVGGAHRRSLDTDHLRQSAGRQCEESKSRAGRPGDSGRRGYSVLPRASAKHLGTGARDRVGNAHRRQLEFQNHRRSHVRHCQEPKPRAGRPGRSRRCRRGVVPSQGAQPERTAASGGGGNLEIVRAEDD